MNFKKLIYTGPSLSVIYGSFSLFKYFPGKQFPERLFQLLTPNFVFNHRNTLWPLHHLLSSLGNIHTDVMKDIIVKKKTREKNIVEKLSFQNKEKTYPRHRMKIPCQ